MKKIITTAIVGTSGFPIKAGTLDFIQQSYQEGLDALAKAVIYDPTTVTILSGCVLSGSGPYTLTAGSVYYAGEIYLVDPISSVQGVGAAFIANIVITPGVPDPVTFSDGSSNSVHNVRKITVVLGTTGTGIGGIDFVNWASINTGWFTASNNNNWVNTGVRFKKYVNGDVQINGVSNSAATAPTTTTVFTLPVGYRPIRGCFFPVYGVITGGLSGGFTGLCVVQNDGTVLFIRNIDVGGGAVPPYDNSARVDFSPIRFSIL
jgi:hypothetical protein